MTDTVPSPKPRILVVDDEHAVIREVYQALARDFQVLQSTAGARAVTLAETMHPDLLLMDIGLGDEDGYAVAAAIRNIAPVPIAFLAYANDNRAKGIELGAVGFLSKPLDRARIAPAVSTWLKRRKSPAGPAGASDFRPDAIARIDTITEIQSALGLKNVGGSPELYLSVLRSLCNTHANIIADLVTALAEGDRSAAILSAHTAKTLLRTIGATELGEIAFGIERALKMEEGRTLHASDLQMRFDLMLKEIRIAIFSEPAPA